MSQDILEAVKKQGEEGLAALKEAADLTFEGAVEKLKLLEVLPREQDYLLQLLWAGHSHLIDLFNGSVYLGFKGVKGSGKTTATEISIHLARDGELLSDTSDAYLSTVLDSGKTVGLDEADRVLWAHKHGMISSLLRSGYTRGAAYGLKEWVPGEGKEKGGWQTVRRSLFGPKVFNFHSTLEAALLSRTLVIDMEPCDDSGMAVRNLFKEKFLWTVKEWLKQGSSEALRDWTRETVEELMLSEEFLREVEALPALTGRDYQLGSILLATAKVLGWDLGGLVARILEGRRTLDEFSDEAHVASRLLDSWEGGQEFVPTMDVLEAVNDERARTKQKPMYRDRLSEVLKELGFRKGKEKGKNWVKRDKWGVKLDEVMVEHLRSVTSIGVEVVEAMEPPLDSITSIGSRGGMEVEEKVLARVFEEGVFGVCDFCHRTGHGLLLIGPRGSGDLKKACPRCADRFDLEEPPGRRETNPREATS